VCFKFNVGKRERTGIDYAPSSDRADESKSTTSDEEVVRLIREAGSRAVVAASEDTEGEGDGKHDDDEWDVPVFREGLD
jgi:hypothetical protein